MFILYAFDKGKWQEFASFKDRADYAEQVKISAIAKLSDAKTETAQNAARVMQAFVLGNYFYERTYGKTILRALRHFDEVGLSNDIHAALEELLDEDYEKFALAKVDTDVTAFTAGDTSLKI